MFTGARSQLIIRGAGPSGAPARRAANHFERIPPRARYTPCTRDHEQPEPCPVRGSSAPDRLRAWPVRVTVRPLMAVRPSLLDRALRPLHRWVWQDPHRRARKLLRFADTESDGGRDLSRAAELTPDPLLRRLYLRHAQDESRHADLFRARATTLLHGANGTTGVDANWFAPGERGLDELEVHTRRDEALLAF